MSLNVAFQMDHIETLSISGDTICIMFGSSEKRT